jgi:hypothetical protein
LSPRSCRPRDATASRRTKAREPSLHPSASTRSRRQRPQAVAPLHRPRRNACKRAGEQHRATAPVSAATIHGRGIGDSNSRGERVRGRACLTFTVGPPAAFPHSAFGAARSYKTCHHRCTIPSHGTPDPTGIHCLCQSIPHRHPLSFDQISHVSSQRNNVAEGGGDPRSWTDTHWHSPQVPVLVIGRRSPSKQKVARSLKVRRVPAQANQHLPESVA